MMNIKEQLDLNILSKNVEHEILRSLRTEETGTLTISIHICMEVGNNDMALKAKWER